MRLRHHIRDHNKPAFTAALDKLGIRYKTKVIGGVGQVLHWNCFELFVYDDDPNWPMLRDLAADHSVRMWHSPIFASDDIASAPWLLAHATADAGYPQPENGAYESKAFDLAHWCQRCGISKVQTRPIRLTGEPKSKTAHFFAPQWMHQILFTRPEVREVFQSARVSGVCYLPALKHRTSAPLTTIVQILPTMTLPAGLVAVVQKQVTCSPHDDEVSRIPISSQSRGSRGDGFCGRVKYHVPDMRRLIHYSRTVFEDSPDIVLSAEWFGSGATASQHVIISNKVARLVLAHKWKGLRLEPIELV